MTTAILTPNKQITKWAAPTAPTLRPFDYAQDAQAQDPAIILIRTFDRKGEWAIEAIFEGGAKVTGTCTADFVNDLESDLSDQGWRVTPSIFTRGFNAKPGRDDCGMIFASSAGLWPDDLGLAEATL